MYEVLESCDGCGHRVINRNTSRNELSAIYCVDCDQKYTPV